MCQESALDASESRSGRGLANAEPNAEMPAVDELLYTRPRRGLYVAVGHAQPVGIAHTAVGVSVGEQGASTVLSTAPKAV